MAVRWACPVILVVLDGVTHRVETNGWDQVAFKTEWGHALGREDLEDPERFLWLTWRACNRQGLYPGPPADFIRDCQNFGIDEDDQAPLDRSKNGSSPSVSAQA